jgi:hypothetical protein
MKTGKMSTYASAMKKPAAGMSTYGSSMKEKAGEGTSMFREMGYGDLGGATGRKEGKKARAPRIGRR